VSGRQLDAAAVTLDHALQCTLRVVPLVIATSPDVVLSIGEAAGAIGRALTQLREDIKAAGLSTEALDDSVDRCVDRPDATDDGHKKTPDAEATGEN
jgi:hypothetical protein